MRNERLIQVQSVSELRPGLVVVMTSCLGCGKQHRLMLVRQDANQPGEILQTRCGRSSFIRWHALPDFHPQTLDAGWAMDLAIKDGRLYRVEDGLESTPAKCALEVRS